MKLALTLSHQRYYLPAVFVAVRRAGGCSVPVSTRVCEGPPLVKTIDLVYEHLLFLHHLAGQKGEKHGSLYSEMIDIR